MFYSLHPVSGKWECLKQSNFKTKLEHIQYESTEFNKKKKQYETKVKCFVDTWFRDDKMRMYDSVMCLPPPLVCPVTVFNLWNGFANEKLPPSTEEEKVLYQQPLEVLLDHIRAV